MAPNIRDSILNNGGGGGESPRMGVNNKVNGGAKNGQSVSCETLYGPYPSAVPVPWRDMDAEGRTGTPVEDESACDFRDEKSPDDWVKRDGRLVRLTGKHPFNVEPPVAILHQYQFITPSSLHYVRNHGACPKLAWDTHTITIHNNNNGAMIDGVDGTAAPPPAVTYTMDDLVTQFAPRELPVTLVCAGNRRKEQNMIRQTIGFNWGPAGVATNVYKGVLLRDLLITAGVDGTDYDSMDGYHVEFIGVEDLPNKVGPGPFPDAQWGKLVKYGTSIPLARAMNPVYDVLIAYEANGAKLQPDHGYPVRLIIPGYIGGRMIKWLAEINVIANETTNHYHYHDNRILPPHITAEESLTGNWWYKPEYIFNELNINSVLTKPDHYETLPIDGNTNKNYELAGYAYTGGGRKISRVEISTDNGLHWELADVKRHEKPTCHGMYWCWIWWTYSIPISHLFQCTEIMCRAWDESNNPQPVSPTWNL
jgi:nitrate reductase (NAD(P)H)